MIIISKVSAPCALVHEGQVSIVDEGKVVKNKTSGLDVFPPPGDRDFPLLFSSACERLTLLERYMWPFGCVRGVRQNFGAGPGVRDFYSM